MIEFGFTCSYTTVRDVEGTSPCGRDAARRTGGEPKCLGHWVVAEMIRGFRVTDRFPRIWGGFLACIAAQGFSSVLAQLWDPPGGAGHKLSGLALVVTSIVACYLGSLSIVLGLERPLGGMLWLYLAPLGAAAIAVHGGAVMEGLESSSLIGVRDTSGAFGPLSALGELAIALIIAAWWLGFWLFYFHKYGWLPWLSLIGTVLTVGLIITGVALTIATSDRLTDLAWWILMGIASVTLTVGVSRFKKLMTKLRV
ncbi:hypothetical protein ACFOY2_22335 [Nonomuraea purpurea]|uniref:DUF2157 domain-containing protein n=1 Tax=Nonomuraea purpurea TaxID=1849276 RepID=A0ABV8GAV4_9ACTN